MASDQRAGDDDCRDQNVHARGTQSAVLLIVVETPDVFDRFRLRFQLEWRQLLREEELVQLPEKRLPEGLFKAVPRQKQVQLWLVGAIGLICSGPIFPVWTISLGAANFLR